MAAVYNQFCDGVADIFAKKYGRVRKEGLDPEVEQIKEK